MRGLGALTQPVAEWFAVPGRKDWPALLDWSTSDGGPAIAVFDSGSRYQVMTSSDPANAPVALRQYGPYADWQPSYTSRVVAADVGTVLHLR